MKIGQKLKELQQKDSAINYKKLKRMIKKLLKEEPDESKPMPSKDEIEKLLKDEVQKVNNFINKVIESIRIRSKFNILESNEHLLEKIKEIIGFLRLNCIGVGKLVKNLEKVNGKLNFDYLQDLRNKIREIKKLKRETGKTIKNEYGNKKSLKYLVPLEESVIIKTELMNLIGIPKYVNNAKSLDDSTVHTVYLDTENCDLANKFIKNDLSSFTVRLRWYGENKKAVKCEMINGKEVISVELNEDAIIPFLRGEIKSEDRNLMLIQSFIIENNLIPSIRTFSKRLIFSNNETSINLDSNIKMVREKLGNKGVNWPFEKIKSSEIVRFPLSVLKIVKNKKSLNLANKFEEQPEFSKFAYGSSFLFPNEVFTPEWLRTVKSENKEEFEKDNSEELNIPSESAVSFNLSSTTSEKKNLISVRVEPKAFFANERTFLNWIEFAIYVGGIGSAMVNLGNVHSFLFGVLVIAVTVLYSLYSLYLYHYRAHHIREKHTVPYDDFFGPALIISIFIFLLILAFVIKFPIKNNGLKPYMKIKDGFE